MMILSEIEPGIIFLDESNGTRIKMNPKQQYLNEPHENKIWVCVVRTGGFEQMSKDSKVRILRNGDK